MGRTLPPSLMSTSAPSHAGWAAGSGASCGGAGLGQPRWPARWRASFIVAQSWAPLLDDSAALSGAAPRPQRAQPRTTTQRARMLGIAAGPCHIGNLQSITVRLEVLPALRPGATNPRGEYCPVPDSGWRRARVGTSSAPLRWPTQRKRKHAQAAQRRALSFTIASQTFASSPDGSVNSSAASSACGPPAATVGSGCRFRASSTVTSSSSPCKHTFGQSRARSSGTRRREGALCRRRQRIPRSVLSRMYPDSRKHTP
jgi:hypothetical protein